eukprot:Platyproteum_vivax@DN4517_c0_g1_i2.p1
MHPLDRVVFVGTGVSSGIPQLSHVFTASYQCAVCNDALNPLSFNRRNNVSVVVQHKNQNILVDVGKTFRDAVLRVFSQQKITKIDAVLLTHDHADAIGGIDDLRDVQEFEFDSKDGHKVYVPKDKMPCYLSKHTYNSIATKFDYITSASTKQHLFRKVTVLDFKVLETGDALSHFTVCGVPVVALPVMHGGDYECLGFAFGDKADRIVYLSDVSAIPDKVKSFLEGFKPVKHKHSK